MCTAPFRMDLNIIAHTLAQTNKQTLPTHTQYAYAHKHTLARAHAVHLKKTYVKVFESLLPVHNFLPSLPDRLKQNYVVPHKNDLFYFLQRFVQWTYNDKKDPSKWILVHVSLVQRNSVYTRCFVLGCCVTIRILPQYNIRTVYSQERIQHTNLTVSQPINLTVSPEVGPHPNTNSNTRAVWVRRRAKHDGRK